MPGSAAPLVAKRPCHACGNPAQTRRAGCVVTHGWYSLQVSDSKTHTKSDLRAARMASAPLPNPHDHSFQAAARRKEVYIGQSGLCHGRGVLAGRNLNRVQDAVVFTCVVDVLPAADIDALTPDDHARIFWQEGKYLCLRGHYDGAGTCPLYLFNTVMSGAPAHVYFGARDVGCDRALVTVRLTAQGALLPDGAEMLWEYAL